MNNNFLEEIERKLQEEQEKLNDANFEKEIADDMKERAKEQEKQSEEAIRALEMARLYAERAQSLIENETAEKTAETKEGNAGDAETKGENEENVVNKENKKAGFWIRLLLIWGTAIAILAGAFKLYRESKTGYIKEATPKIGTSDSVNDQPEDVTEAASYTFDYDGSAVTTGDYEYVPLTDEEFEKLTTETINTLRGYGVTTSDEDIIKYVMIRNIDKLRQDNNEMINKIVGDQDPVEVFADADNVIDDIMTYNLLYFDQNHNTDGFISSSVGIFDETQKARVLEIEGRVFEIGANYQDEEKYNELTYALLRDMIDPSKDISELEDGVSYGVMWINMYMVRSTFGTDRYIKLNDTNADMVKYYVSFAGDGEEYEMNALVNGNVRNINALLAECTKGKTLTR